MDRAKESIVKQKVGGRPLDNFMLDKNISENFSSGRKKQEGDFLLFGLLLTNKEEEEFKLISFHEDEIGTFYEEDSEMYELNPLKKWDFILPYLKTK